MRPPLILAYHMIADVASEHDPDNLAIAPDKFCWQIESLLARDYEFVALSEFVRRLRDGSPPQQTCVLTFDDGSADDATLLPELLRSFGDLPATLFVCPGMLGEDYPWLSHRSGARFMAEDELLDVAKLPMIEIGSHTNRHARLSNAGAAQALEEMSSSKRRLEELIGEPVDTFAYPFCDYSPDCPGAAELAGYSCAVTCGARGGWHPYELKRQMMDRDDGRIAFGLKSRDLFHTVKESPPWRLARRVRDRVLR